jgi:hypothetical protein
MGKEVFQLYLNTQNPNANNVSQPTLISGICSVSAGSSVLTINSVDTTMTNSIGQYVYYVPLVYGMKILIPTVSASPIYILTQISGLSGISGGAGTYYMSYTPLVNATLTPYTGLPNKNSYNFMINWDTLFAEARLNNYYGRLCKIGVDFLTGQSVLAYSSSELDVGEYYNGQLVCNLATNRNNKNLPYTVLGNTDILNASIEDPVILALAPSYKSMFFKLNTMQPTKTTDIMMPTGSSCLNIALQSWSTVSQAFTPQMIDVDWSIILSFEIIEE